MIFQQLFHQPTDKKCANCNNILYKNTIFPNTPELLILHIPYANIKIDTSFKFFYNKRYELRGVVYYNNNHYTSHIILEDKSVWYHDGIQTGKNMILEKSNSFYKSKNWNKYNNKNAILFIYIYI